MPDPFTIIAILSSIVEAAAEVLSEADLDFDISDIPADPTQVTFGGEIPDPPAPVSQTKGPLFN